MEAMGLRQTIQVARQMNTPFGTQRAFATAYASTLSELGRGPLVQNFVSRPDLAGPLAGAELPTATEVNSLPAPPPVGGAQGSSIFLILIVVAVVCFLRS